MRHMRHCILYEHYIDFFNSQEAFNNVRFPAAHHFREQRVFDFINLWFSAGADLLIQLPYPRGHAAHD